MAYVNGRTFKFGGKMELERAKWVAQKNVLCRLVKLAEEIYKGDDLEFVKKVCRELIEAHKESYFDEAIHAYRECIELAILDRKLNKHGEQRNGK